MMLNIKIPEKEHGTRLDRCVRRLLGQLNQSLLEKFLRSGMILLDGKKLSHQLRYLTVKNKLFTKIKF